ncbi:hypothetical protein V6N13_040469 [Hibiscus sabdariffa]
MADELLLFSFLLLNYVQPKPVFRHCRIADAEENLGESEVREAHLAKSLYYIQIGEKGKALEQLKVTETKTVAVGQKMDLVVDAPEILTVIGKIPHLSEFLNSLYNCQYKSFFLAFGSYRALLQHCKIDKVAGVLETNRPDAKNALYQATIKQGDFLLNRIQKLSRVIDL